MAKRRRQQLTEVQAWLQAAQWFDGVTQGAYKIEQNAHLWRTLEYGLLNRGPAPVALGLCQALGEMWRRRWITPRIYKRMSRRMSGYTPSLDEASNRGGWWWRTVQHYLRGECTAAEMRDGAANRATFAGLMAAMASRRISKTDLND